MVDIRGGNRREKRFCVRVQRFGEQLLGWTCLDELAQIHDADVVRNMTDNRHIMRDKHIGDAQLILQIHQQVENLRLNGDVQCRYRLITDDELGIQCQCAGNADTLTAAAVHLMRVGKAQPTVQTDKVHQTLGFLINLCFAEAARQDKRLTDRLLHGHARIQGGIWVLENNLYGILAQLLQLLGVDAGDILALEQDLAVRTLMQVNQGAAQCGLAAAGLADNAHCGAAFNGEAHIVHSVKLAARRREIFF